MIKLPWKVAFMIWLGGVCLAILFSVSKNVESCLRMEKLYEDLIEEAKEKYKDK